MDTNYAREKLELVLRDLSNYNDGEFWRELSRIAYGSTQGYPNPEELEKDLDNAEETIISMTIESADLTDQLNSSKLRNNKLIKGVKEFIHTLKDYEEFYIAEPERVSELELLLSEMKRKIGE